jgi:hypothetical protein
MSAFSGPEISTSGLIFYYDVNNTEKSWKGKPTTNLLNPSWATWSVDGSGQGNIGTRTILSAFYCRIDDVNQNTRQSTFIEGISANTTYTFSVKYKKISGTPTLRFQIQAYNGGSYISTMSFATTAELGITDKEDWQTASITLTTPANTTRILWFMQDGDDYATYSHSFELKEPQAEVGSIYSPFVDGTRSNTQAILDLTNNNTITVQNLSYSSGGSFSFDGVDDSIDSTTSAGLTGTGSWTMESVFKINGIPSNATYGNVIVDTDATGSSANMILVDYGGGHGGSQNQLLYASRPSTGGSYTLLGGPILTQGTYYHVAVVRNDVTNTKLYVNGSLYSTYSGNVPTATQPLVRIGRWTDGTVYGNSTIPNVKIYNRALSDQEIAQNFQALRGRYGV